MFSIFPKHYIIKTSLLHKEVYLLKKLNEESYLKKNTYTQVVQPLHTNVLLPPPSPSMSQFFILLLFFHGDWADSNLGLSRRLLLFSQGNFSFVVYITYFSYIVNMSLLFTNELPCLRSYAHP